MLVTTHAEARRRELTAKPARKSVLPVAKPAASPVKIIVTIDDDGAHCSVDVVPLDAAPGKSGAWICHHGSDGVDYEYALGWATRWATNRGHEIREIVRP